LRRNPVWRKRKRCRHGALSPFLAALGVNSPLRRLEKGTGTTAGPWHFRASS